MDLPRKNSQSFLDKFDGKKQHMGREGLLHILQRKRDSQHHHTPKGYPSQQSEEIHPRGRKEKEFTPVTTPKKKEKQQKSKALSSQQGRAKLVAHLGFDLGDHHNHKADLQQPPISHKSEARLKLPAISKSSSHSSSLHMKLHSYKPTKLYESGKSLNKQSDSQRTPQSRSLILNNLTKKMQLDKYALRHLEFMDKFERQLMAINFSHVRTPQRPEQL